MSDEARELGDRGFWVVGGGSEEGIGEEGKERPDLRVACLKRSSV